MVSIYQLLIRRDGGIKILIAWLSKPMPDEPGISYIDYPTLTVLTQKDDVMLLYPIFSSGIHRGNSIYTSRIL